MDGTLKKVLKTKNLLISKQIPKSEVIDVFVITVGTPIDKNKKTITEMIFNVSKEIDSVLKDNDLIIFRSTVEIGSTRKICKQIFNKTQEQAENIFKNSFPKILTVARLDKRKNHQSILMCIDYLVHIF